MRIELWDVLHAVTQLTYLIRIDRNPTVKSSFINFTYMYEHVSLARCVANLRRVVSLRVISYLPYTNLENTQALG